MMGGGNPAPVLCKMNFIYTYAPHTPCVVDTSMLPIDTLDNPVDSTDNPVDTSGGIPGTDITFFVFPNPTSAEITLSVAPEFIGSIYSLVNHFGVVVMSGTLTDENVTLSMADLSPGIYIFKVDGMKKTSFRMIMKQ
jgi:hypothetical protein